MKTPTAYKARQELLNPFTIDYLGSDGRRMKGNFVSKKLAIRDIAALSVRKIQLNGGMHHDSSTPGHGVDATTDNWNNMIATIEICLVETPQWWNLDELVDPELLALVYEKVVDFENTFLERLRKKNQAGKRDSVREGRSAPDSSEADEEGSFGEMVGDEVSDALEP